MPLRSLRLERFCGVRSAEVSFEPMTVLIGENDCGMSSVLEALAIALSSADGEAPRFGRHHFHLAPDGTWAGPLRIEVMLDEPAAGAWDSPELEALAPILVRNAVKPRKLAIEITAEPPDDSMSEAGAQWRVHCPGGGSVRNERAVLAAARSIHPLVWLRGGSLVRALLPAEAEAEPVLRGYHDLLRGASGSVTMESGFAAARRLLGDLIPEAVRKPEMRGMVAEILARGSRAPGDPAGGPIPRTGSTAQELGVLLVAAELVRELRRTAAPGTRPIILLEEPEAHLHPMTLASVWSLLSRIDTQKIITTQSGTLLSAAPLRSVRRLVRGADGEVRERRVTPSGIGKDDLRRVGYHLRSRRSVACFARVWLLVEGETEFWIFPDLARLCGYDFAQEGVVCVEFAQCGIAPLVKLANNLGIAWHVLTDGDRAGGVYADTVRQLLPQVGEAALHLTQLAELDIEHCFWHHGQAPLFERLAGMRANPHVSPTKIIRKALDRQSKPAVAFELLASVAAAGVAGIPPQLRTAIDTCVWLARGERPRVDSVARTRRRRDVAGAPARGEAL